MQNSTSIVMLMLAARVDRLSELSTTLSKTFATLVPFGSKLAQLGHHIDAITTPIIKTKDTLTHAINKLDAEVSIAQSPLKMQLAGASADCKTQLNGLDHRLISFSNKAKDLIAYTHMLDKEYTAITHQISGADTLFDSVQAKAALAEKLANLTQQSRSFREMSQPLLNDAETLHQKIRGSIPSAAVRNSLTSPLQITVDEPVAPIVRASAAG